MTHYEVLGVDPAATAAAVRQAYLALARLHHPDRPGGDAATMRAVNEAWATLGDPARRATYDLGLVGRPSATAPVAEDRAGRGDEADLLEDLGDDTPIGGVVVLPRWLSLLPVGAFATSVGLFGGGLTFGSSSALALSMAVFGLSCALFLAAPFVALLSSRRSRR